MDIDIWVSELEHSDKFKAVITNMNTMRNPNLFAIPTEIWAPYQNFRVYSGWYNEGLYEWAYDLVQLNMPPTLSFSGMYQKPFIYRRNRTNS